MIKKGGRGTAPSPNDNPGEKPWEAVGKEEGRTTSLTSLTKINMEKQLSDIAAGLKGLESKMDKKMEQVLSKMDFLIRERMLKHYREKW